MTVRRLFCGVTALLAMLAFAVPVAYAAADTTTACEGNRLYSQIDWDGNLVVPSEVGCDLEGVTVDGTADIQPGGNLNFSSYLFDGEDFTPGYLGGNLLIEHGGTFYTYKSTVSDIQTDDAKVLSGEEAEFGSIDGTFDGTDGVSALNIDGGNVATIGVTGMHGTAELRNTEVHGASTVTRFPLTLTRSRVDGDLNLIALRTSTICGTTVDGTLSIKSQHTGTVTRIGGQTGTPGCANTGTVRVSGNLVIDGDAGSVTLSRVEVSGNLFCVGTTTVVQQHVIVDGTNSCG